PPALPPGAAQNRGQRPGGQPRTAQTGGGGGGSTSRRGDAVACGAVPVRLEERLGGCRGPVAHGPALGVHPTSGRGRLMPYARVTPERLQRFLDRLGQEFRNPGRVYLVGGTGLLYEGLKGATKDIDLTAQIPASDREAFTRTLIRLRNELQIP